jgi:hypothetical protein
LKLLSWEDSPLKLSLVYWTNIIEIGLFS